MKRITAALLATVALVLGVGAGGAQAADTCPNAAYRKGVGANLPNCRAWEQATPVEKGGYTPVATAPGSASPDGSRVIFNSQGNVGNGPGSVAFSAYFASSRASAWGLTKVDPIADFNENPNYLFGQVTMGFSADSLKALVISTHKLAPEATEDATNFYVRDLRDGSLTFAASIPGRETYNQLIAVGNAIFYGASADFSRIAVQLNGLSEISGGRITRLSIDTKGNPLDAIGPGAASNTLAQQEVSRDGRRVTFVGPSFQGTPGLFQRVDGNRTVLISYSRRTGDRDTGIGTGGPWPSADGTRVTFATDNGAEPLTNDGPGPLYQWDAQGDDGRLTSLLAGATPALPSDAGSVQIRDVSPDGRYVWFTYLTGGGASSATAVLDASAKRITTVAPIYAQDPNVRFSPDGTRIALTATQSLTGYDQTGDPSCGGPCAEVFAFDAKKPDVPLACLSCGPAGTHSRGNSTLGQTNGQFPIPLSVALTDDGRVVFDTAQPLAPADANAVSDVYQYTPGAGNQLLSSGTSLLPSTLYSESTSGNDVFFATDEQLVAQDDDFDTDVYDARAGGGLAAQQVTRPSGITCPTGDCPGSQPALPDAETPPTASFQPQAKAARFTVSRVSAAARRAAAASGRLKVTATVSAAGRLSARASSKSGRRSSTIATASASPRKAGRTTLTLKLSSAARRELARGRRMSVALSVSYSRASRPASQSFVLAKPRTRSSAKGGAR